MNLILIASVCCSFLIWFCLQQSNIKHGDIPPSPAVTFPGCLTHTRHHSIKLLFFQILLLGQEDRRYVRKYFYNSGCNAFHRTHNRNSKINDQRREVCTAIMKKFADIEEIANQNEACLVIGPELLFHCIDMLYPCVSGNWNLECGSSTSPSTTDNL